MYTGVFYINIVQHLCELGALEMLSSEQQSQYTRGKVLNENVKNWIVKRVKKQRRCQSIVVAKPTDHGEETTLYYSYLTQNTHTHIHTQQ